MELEIKKAFRVIKSMEPEARTYQVYGSETVFELKKEIELDKLIQNGETGMLIAQTSILDEIVRSMKAYIEENREKMNAMLAQVSYNCSDKSNRFGAASDRNAIEFTAKAEEAGMSAEALIAYVEEAARELKKEKAKSSEAPGLHPDLNERMRLYLEANEEKLKTQISPKALAFLKESKVLDVYEKEDPDWGSDYEVIVEYRGEEATISFINSCEPEIDSEIGLKKGVLSEIQSIYAQVPIFWD